MDTVINIQASDFVQGVSPETSSVTNQLVGYARVFVPFGVDRQEYVDSCFRTGRIDLFDENSGLPLRQCYVTTEVLQNIKFPKENGDVGMGVVWVAQPPLYSSIMVVGTFPVASRVNIRNDEQFVVEREWNGNSFSIIGDAKDGSLNIKVESAGASVVRITTLGNEDSTVALKSNGAVTVEADREVDVRSFQKIDAQLVNPETDDETGVVVDKDRLEFAANYTVGEDKINYTKATVSKDGLAAEQYFCEETPTTKHTLSTTKDGLASNSAIKGDDVIYTNVVTEDKCETVYKDIILSLKEKQATLSQGGDMGVKVELKNGKAALINQFTSLKELIDKISSTIQNLTVATPAGPSGTPLPPTIIALSELKVLLNQLFNE